VLVFVLLFGCLFHCVGIFSVTIHRMHQHMEALTGKRVEQTGGEERRSIDFERVRRAVVPWNDVVC